MDLALKALEVTSHSLSALPNVEVVSSSHWVGFSATQKTLLQSEIFSVMDQSNMTGTAWVIGVNRRPDFFRFLQSQSQHWMVILVRNSRGHLKALGSFTIRKSHPLGEKTVTLVGYLGDLRTLPDREVSVRWRQCLSALVESFSYPLLTVIIDSNLIALNALFRSKRNSFQYHLLSQYQMVNCLAKIPIPWKPTVDKKSDPFISQLLISRHQYKNLNADILTFLKDQSENKIFRNLQPDELQRRLNHWEGLKDSKLTVIQNRQGLILGLGSLWSPKDSKKNVLHRSPPSYRWLSRALRALAHTQGIPIEGEDVQSQTLVQLQLREPLNLLEKRQVFGALLTDLWRSKAAGVVSFLDFQSFSPICNLGSDINFSQGWMTQRIPMSLYLVKSKSAPLATWIDPEYRMLHPIEFEMALV